VVKVIAVVVYGIDFYYAGSGNDGGSYCGRMMVMW
jgi:hypothetical protein